MNGTPPVAAMVDPEMYWRRRRPTSRKPLATQCPGRFIGVWEPDWLTLWIGMVEGISGVQNGPDAIQLTRMHAYAARAAFGLFALTDAVLMIEPPGFRCAAALQEEIGVDVRPERPVEFLLGDLLPGPCATS